jgi:hypothetical protein
MSIIQMLINMIQLKRKVNQKENLVVEMDNNNNNNNNKDN